MSKKTSIRVVSGEEQTPIHVKEQWLDELLEQKRYIAQLQDEIDQLREELKQKKSHLQAAEARLFALIEEAGQKYLPFESQSAEAPADET